MYYDAWHQTEEGRSSIWKFFVSVKISYPEWEGYNVWIFAVLQTLLCPAPFKLSNSNRSCYLHQATTRFVPKAQLQQTCQSLHPMAHLVAINTQQEHIAIKTFMQTAAPSCQYVWTAAKTHVPGQAADWFWE